MTLRRKTGFTWNPEPLRHSVQMMFFKINPLFLVLTSQKISWREGKQKWHNNLLGLPLKDNSFLYFYTLLRALFLEYSFNCFSNLCNSPWLVKISKFIYDVQITGTCIWQSKIYYTPRFLPPTHPRPPPTLLPHHPPGRGNFVIPQAPSLWKSIFSAAERMGEEIMNIISFLSSRAIIHVTFY